MTLSVEFGTFVSNRLGQVSSWYNRERAVGTVTRLRPGETRKRGLIMGKDKRYFLSPIGADWSWGPIRLPDNWVPQAVCAEVERPRREAGRLPSSAEVKTVIHPVPS